MMEMVIEYIVKFLLALFCILLAIIMLPFSLFFGCLDEFTKWWNKSA